MKKIRNKKDIRLFMEKFDTLTDFDRYGEKHYFVFKDKFKGGIITVMKYPNQAFTFHAKGENYCDEQETLLDETHLVNLLWEHRKHVNESIRSEPNKTEELPMTPIF